VEIETGIKLGPIRRRRPARQRMATGTANRFSAPTQRSTQQPAAIGRRQESTPLARVARDSRPNAASTFTMGTAQSENRLASFERSTNQPKDPAVDLRIENKRIAKICQTAGGCEPAENSHKTPESAQIRMGAGKRYQLQWI